MFGHLRSIALAVANSIATMMTILKTLIMMMIMMMIMMAFRQIPTMTKSHHGGNMSLIGEVGFCHRHIPTIDNHNDEVGFGGMVDQLRFVKV